VGHYALQSAAVCCSVLQCVAACCSVLNCSVLRRVAACCCVLQHVAMCCSVSQCILHAEAFKFRFRELCSHKKSYMFIRTKETYMHTNEIFTQMRPPLTEEIRLKIFGSPDYPVFLDSLLSDGDSVYSSQTLFEILGTPEETCLICTGTPVKTCWKFWQS